MSSVASLFLLVFTDLLVSQSFRDVSFCPSFEFFHFSFDALIRLVHRCRLTQFILSCYFIFIDTHVYVSQ